MISLQIICIGRVQGVFFRKYAEQEARRLGLSGWVRNQSDGSVEINASGESHQLQSLISWCKTGSPMSEVTEVKVSEVVVDEVLPNPFQVRY